MCKPFERRIILVWKIKDSTRNTVDRFGVIIDEVVLPNGEDKTFSYLEVASGVCILPITSEHKVLCLKQYRHSLKSWEWELPAGKIDVLEENPITTAKKELEGETGYIANNWLELGSFHPSPGSTNEEIFLFAAAGLSPTKQNLETSEQIELHELTMDELKDLIKNGDFKHGAGLAAILRYKFMID
jgi:ADP-ribose pyrophosphatase